MKMKYILGAVSLLASASAFSATVEVRTVAGANVVNSSGCCTASIDTDAGNTFSVIVHGEGFPETAGATLGLTWNSAAANIASIVLAPGSTFTGGVVAAAPWNPISILGPLVGTLPSGTFDSFQVNFTAVASNAAPQALNLTFIDDQSDLCWSDAATFGCVVGTTYTQANITVGNAVPVPAAAWLIAPAVLAAGRFSRRRKAA
jgi:hypothetical protein